jgi:alpha-galactosidase
VRDTQAFLTELTGADPDRVRFLTAGFNHQAFVLRFEQDGQSLYPKLAEVIDASPELQRRVRVEFFRRFGYFPTESSEHSSEYLPWFMRDPAAQEQFRIPVNEYIRRSEENLAEYEQMKTALERGEDLEIERSNEYASLIIHSVLTGQERVIYGNVRNDGLISNLLEGACVEVPCLVDRNGVQPTAIGELPPQLAALNRTFLNVCELTVRAALEGNRDHVYHAALLDPAAAATLSPEQIHDVVDELIAAHGDALPAGLTQR